MNKRTRKHRGKMDKKQEHMAKGKSTSHAAVGPTKSTPHFRLGAISFGFLLRTCVNIIFASSLGLLFNNLASK